jgi:hypothetical protein
MGDEHQAEGFRAVQPLEQIDDVGFGILVEVAGDRDAALLAAGHARGIEVRAVG